MSGSALRTACAAGFTWDVERILTGAQDVSLMRSPIGTGVQSEGWVRRRDVVTIISDPDHLGNSALHVCVMNSKPEVMAMLLKIPGTDVNIPGLGGYSPAAMACDRNESECLRILLEAGVDVNQQDQTGWTLLHHAAVGRCQEAMAVLLEREQPGTEHPIIVDLANESGQTPLMLACIKNDSITIRRLVIAGADPHRLHEDTQTTAIGMCGSQEARGVCEEALSERKEILISRGREEEERLERLAFKESLKQHENGSKDEDDNDD